MESTMQSPVVRRWWAVRRVLFDPEFRVFIDALPTSSAVPGLSKIVGALRGDEAPAA
jgi:hypothetical protein